jgi:hypothetical protein
LPVSEAFFPTSSSFVFLFLQYPILAPLNLGRLRYDPIMKFILSIFNLVTFLVIVKLVSAKKTSYQSKGRGGTADMSGGYCGDWPFDNYLYVYATENASKVKGDGIPGKTVVPYMSAFFSLWTDCLADSATLIQYDWENSSEPMPPTLSFPKNNNLETGSAVGVFPAREIPCELFKETYEDGSEYVYYNCDYSISIPISVDVSVVWTGTGEPFQERSTYTSRYAGVFYKTSSTGKRRDASFTLEVTVDGAPFDVEDVFDESSYKYGSLSKNTFSEMSKYQIS